MGCGTFWVTQENLRTSLLLPAASPLLPSVQGCGVEGAVLKTRPRTRCSQGTHTSYESGQPCAVPSTDAEATCHCHRPRSEACPFFTSPLNPSLSSLFCCLCFPFPQFMLLPSVSSFILVKQIPFRGQSFSIFLII